MKFYVLQVTILVASTNVLCSPSSTIERSLKPIIKGDEQGGWEINYPINKYINSRLIRYNEPKYWGKAKTLWDQPDQYVKATAQFEYKGTGLLVDVHLNGSPFRLSMGVIDNNHHLAGIIEPDIDYQHPNIVIDVPKEEIPDQLQFEGGEYTLDPIDIDTTIKGRRLQYYHPGGTFTVDPYTYMIDKDQIPSEIIIEVPRIKIDRSHLLISTNIKPVHSHGYFFGFGFGTPPSSNSNFRYTFDIGVIHQSRWDVEITAEGKWTEIHPLVTKYMDYYFNEKETEFEDKWKGKRTIPFFQAGVSYAF